MFMKFGLVFVLHSLLLPLRMSRAISSEYKLTKLILRDGCPSYHLNPSRPNPVRREKIKVNFYFYTSLSCLKRFYEGLKRLHRTF